MTTKFSKAQMRGVMEVWDSLILLSDVVLEQFFNHTDKGIPVDWNVVPSYDHHVLDDLLCAHRFRPLQDKEFLESGWNCSMLVDDLVHSNPDFQRRFLRLAKKRDGFLLTYIKNLPGISKVAKEVDLG